MSKLTTQFTTVIEHPCYVGDALKNLCRSENINPSLMDNRQLLLKARISPRLTTKKSLIVGVAVGASNKIKMMRLSNFGEIIKKISANFSFARIVLLGAGPRDETYAKQLLAITNSSIENKVSSLNLQELTAFVESSHVIIGYDSAVYNLAFTNFSESNVSPKYTDIQVA